jgi:hypothetical protein
LAGEISTVPYSEKRFQNILPEIKALMCEHPQNFFQKLQGMCANVGVKVVFTPCLPKVPISGSARWLGDTPLIQLSGRYKRNDIFWFTFFHEAGHILQHGKKDIFLEAVDYEDKDIEKENEADVFAAKWLLSPEQEKEILDDPYLTVEKILEYAERFQTHPAMIIGRIQYRTKQWTFGHEYILPIHLDDVHSENNLDDE